MRLKEEEKESEMPGASEVFVGGIAAAVGM